MLVSIYPEHTLSQYLLSSYILKAYLNKYWNNSNRLEIDILNYPASSQSNEISKAIAESEPDYVGYSCTPRL